MVDTYPLERMSPIGPSDDNEEAEELGNILFLQQQNNVVDNTLQLFSRKFLMISII